MFRGVLEGGATGLPNKGGGSNRLRFNSWFSKLSAHVLRDITKTLSLWKIR